MRMTLKNTHNISYICFMKSRVNLTIENDLLSEVKRYAQKQHTSVSDLVENFFKTLTKQPKRKSILDLLDEIEAPVIDTNADLKDLYYQEQAKKHGF